MAVTITKVKRPPCTTCGGKHLMSYEVVSQGKKATMTLPCVMCSPIMRGDVSLPYLGLASMKPIANAASDEELIGLKAPHSKSSF